MEFIQGVAPIKSRPQVEAGVETKLQIKAKDGARVARKIRMATLTVGEEVNTDRWDKPATLANPLRSCLPPHANLGREPLLTHWA